MRAAAKGLASRRPRGRVLRSRVHIAGRAGPPVDGLPFLFGALPAARSHGPRGHAGRRRNRTVDSREGRGIRPREGATPRGRRRGPRPRIRGSPPESPDVAPADTDGSRGGWFPRQNESRGLRRGGAAGPGRLGRTPSPDPNPPNTGQCLRRPTPFLAKPLVARGGGRYHLSAGWRRSARHIRGPPRYSYITITHL